VKILIVIRFFFLLMSFKRNNVLIRCLNIILRLIIISPILCLITLSWYIYLINILFVRGVFILIIYVTSIGSIFFKTTTGIILLIFLYLLFSIPLFFYSPIIGGIRTFFNSVNINLIVGLIGFLIILIGFTSYIVIRRGAIRKF